MQIIPTCTIISLPQTPEMQSRAHPGVLPGDQTLVIEFHQWTCVAQGSVTRFVIQQVSVGRPYSLMAASHVLR